MLMIYPVMTAAHAAVAVFQKENAISFARCVFFRLRRLALCPAIERSSGILSLRLVRRKRAVWMRLLHSRRLARL